MKLPPDLYSIKNPVIRKTGVAFFTIALFPIYLLVHTFVILLEGIKGFLQGMLDTLEISLVSTGKLLSVIKRAWKGH